jgi:hypothetical protein
MAKFWWWIEYYSDLTNRGPQVILAAEQYPHLRARVAPQLGVFRP